MKVAIVNDTSYSNHFGCKLTMQVLRSQLEKRGAEIIGTVPYNDKNIRPHFDMMCKADLVIVNGEGSIHHDRRWELINIARYFPAVLINAVYQENHPNNWLHLFGYVSVRESMSQTEMKAHGVDVEIVPDLVFDSEELRAYKHNPKKDLIVTDSTNNHTGLCAMGNNFIKELCNHRMVCTGRFHGIVACAVLGIPFSAYASNTHKNESLMYDMQYHNSYYKEPSNACLIPGKLPDSVTEYANLAPARIEAMFDKILSL